MFGPNSPDAFQGQFFGSGIAGFFESRIPGTSFKNFDNSGEINAVFGDGSTDLNGDGFARSKTNESLNIRAVQQAIRNPIESSIKATIGVLAGKLASSATTSISNSLNAIKNITNSDKKALRSLQKNIDDHITRRDTFISNPTIRPGMENLPNDLIKQQQQRRINHLNGEIREFRKQIDDILNGR